MLSLSTTGYPAETTHGTITQFIPLTTIFTYPTFCSKSLLLEVTTLEAFDPRYDGMVSAISCVPPAVISSEFLPNSETGLVFQLFSLGPFICPQFWETMTTSTKDLSSTLTVCCPPGYNVLTGDTCLSSVPENEILTFASPAEKLTGPSWSFITSAATTSVTAFASAIVGWNVAPQTTSSSSTAALAPSQTSSPLQTSSPSQSTSGGSPLPTSLASSNGLSIGVKAAIGVSSSIGVVLVIAVLAMFMVRRRKRAAATEKPLDLIETLPYGQKSELSGEGKYAGELPAGVGEELPGSQTLAAELEMPRSQELEAEQARLELVGTTRSQELPAGQNFRAELYGDSRDALNSQPHLSQRNQNPI